MPTDKRSLVIEFKVLTGSLGRDADDLLNLSKMVEDLEETVKAYSTDNHIVVKDVRWL